MKKIVLSIFALFLFTTNAISQQMTETEKVIIPTRYATIGCKWNKTHLKYYIYNSSSSLTAQQESNAIMLVHRPLALAPAFYSQTIMEALGIGVLLTMATIFPSPALTVTSADA